MIRQFELVENVKAYDPTADEDALNRAYVFSMQAHGAQQRASGDPYFTHPLEVAGILTRYKLDSASIVTALLHDTLEDTTATEEEIRRQFGPEIAHLVDGVTKLSKLELQSNRAKQAENFRKLVLAMSRDIRVLLVKLADRLHNMRTLHFIAAPEKRARIARETMEIYAPLAERIGMNDIKDELEDLAFAELNPDARESIVRRLTYLRQAGSDLVGRVLDELRRVFAEENLDAAIFGREKKPYSVWRKMQRQRIGFEQLSDIMAFRVVVNDVPDCYRTLGIIHGRYQVVPGRFKDYISTPKPNGYRSLHTAVLGPGNQRIEVQIRTQEMHEIAERGVAAHWHFKQSEGAGQLDSAYWQAEGRQYRWLQELLDIIDSAAGPEEFLEHTRLEMFSDQVFCFSPKGDVYALPRAATTVDFAYAVHTDLGDHCVGAKVNGRLVP
ncbi:MAG: RelA/SpoT family protein, partial [Alphaproteobacteria bacterium]